MRKQPKKIGGAVVGARRVGLIRGEVAARCPKVKWIGIAEKNPERGQLAAEKIGAEFLAADFRELLLAGPESA
jgi:predicted dehydrogenase